MSPGTTALLVAATLGATPLAAAPDTPPVRLTSEPTEGGVIFRVVGAAQVETALVYRLQIDGGRGGNRVSQSGRGMLKPGQEHVLATVNISTPEYKARLWVHFDDGGGYQTVVTSPAAADDGASAGASRKDDGPR